MRTARAFLILALLTLAPATLLAQDDASAQQEEASTVALDWVALVDSALYAESWQQASPAFQSGISEEQWQQAVQQVRSQVGDLQNRTLQDSQFRTSLPNAPAGEYVVLQYISSFERLPQAMEMVVMTKTEDDAWKAAGYQVVPAQQQGAPSQGGQQQDN